MVRTRLEGICRAAAVTLADLLIQVITVASLRLDRDEDRLHLQATVATLRPVLLVLDPFVRLHRIDENASSECRALARLLARAAALRPRRRARASCAQRRGPAPRRPGLSGSSELHTWGDSSLYLRRVPGAWARSNACSLVNRPLPRQRVSLIYGQTSSTWSANIVRHVLVEPPPAEMC